MFIIIPTIHKLLISVYELLENIKIINPIPIPKLMIRKYGFCLGVVNSLSLFKKLESFIYTIYNNYNLATNTKLSKLNLKPIPEPFNGIIGILARELF